MVVNVYVVIGVRVLNDSEEVRVIDGAIEGVVMPIDVVDILVIVDTEGLGDGDMLVAGDIVVDCIIVVINVDVVGIDIDNTVVGIDV